MDACTVGDFGDESKISKMADCVCGACCFVSGVVRCLSVGDIYIYVYKYTGSVGVFSCCRSGRKISEIRFHFVRSIFVIVVIVVVAGDGKSETDPSEMVSVGDGSIGDRFVISRPWSI